MGRGPLREMKVLELVESAGGGVGRHVIDLSEGALARGHEVHLVYSPLRIDKVFRNDIVRLGSRGVRIFPLHMERGPCIKDIITIRSLRQHLNLHGPFDLIHCHSTKAGLIGRLGLLGKAVKRLYTPGGFFTMDPNNNGLGQGGVAVLEAVLSKFCDAVITVSRQEYLHGCQLGIARSKLRLIPHGVALDRPIQSPRDRFAVRRGLGVCDEDVCIGFVGRLVPVKSPRTMLESFATLLCRTRTATKLVIVGDGPLAQSLCRLSGDLGIAEKVIWLGERDAKSLMGIFDLCALTSDSEAGPLVVLEAMARGLPIVATRVGGISETVQHGVNGFIAPVRGVQEIATALETLVDNPELRRQMGHASLTISRNFSVDRMVDQTIALYEQVISGHQATAMSRDLKMAATR